MIRKILVIQTASIGDVILATPALEKLHRHHPGAAIDLLVKRGNEGLFTGHPWLNEVIVWDKKRNKYRNFDRLLHRVWFARYDAVVNLQRFFLTGLMTALSRAPIRIGFDRNPLSGFFTVRVEHRIGSGIHETERNSLLVASITDDTVEQPRLYPSADDKKMAAPYMAGLYYTISPASLWFTKQYPSSEWIRLVKSIPADTPVYLLGSGSDIRLCEDIIEGSGHPRCISLAGKLSLLASAALMSEARMNFTNDSAPMHLAASVDAPVTVVYCSTTPDFGFGPRSSDCLVVETPLSLPCRPCGLHGQRNCPEKHFRCALTIPVELLTGRL